MVLIEATLWPLVVVGVLPDSPGEEQIVTPITEERLWSCNGLRLALVVAGTGARARAGHEGVFAWLRRHRAALSRRTFRVAWVVEDDTMRMCAETWQALAGDRLLGAESMTFRTFGPALSWLLDDDSADGASDGKGNDNREQVMPASEKDRRAGDCAAKGGGLLVA